MNDYINNKYKPYRISINKNVTIIDSTSGKYVIKDQVKDLFTLYNYLDAQGFTNHPVIDYNSQTKKYVTNYVQEDYLPNEQKVYEIAKLLAFLHTKTVYFKETSIDNFKEIKELILENINYMQSFYEGLFLSALKKEFQSPSEYLLVRNYYKIKASLLFAKDNIERWYDKTDKARFRVSVIHNNLSFDHFIYNVKESIFISWDKYRIDNPIIDLINFYQAEFENCDFKVFYEEYSKYFTLLDSERELLFIILAIPYPINLNIDKEIERIKQIKKVIDYLYKSESIIRPYYSKKEIKE